VYFRHVALMLGRIDLTCIVETSRLSTLPP